MIFDFRRPRFESLLGSREKQHCSLRNMNKTPDNGGKDTLIRFVLIMSFQSNETENKLDLLYFNSMEIIISFILINKHSLKVSLMIYTYTTHKIQRNLAEDKLGISVVEGSQTSNGKDGIWKKRKMRLSKKKQRQIVQESGFNSSLWKNQENRSYMDFLISNEGLFGANRKQRRLMKINVLMSDWVKTRSPDQCRSHHQKMLKYHRDIANIILHIRSLPVQVQSPKQETQSHELQEVPLVFDHQLSNLMAWVEYNEDNRLELMNQRWLDGVDEFYGGF